MITFDNENPQKVADTIKQENQQLRENEANQSSQFISTENPRDNISIMKKLKQIQVDGPVDFDHND